MSGQIFRFIIVFLRQKKQNITIMRKYIIPLTAIAIVALSVWIHSRWDVWFANPVEEPYTTLPYPSRIMLTPGTLSQNDRNISYQCDSLLKPSKVQYTDLSTGDTTSISAYGEVYASPAGTSAYYIARLRNLVAGHRYSYRAVTGDSASRWYNFAIPEIKDETSFIYFGDIQDTIGGVCQNAFRMAMDKHPETELVVLGGDFANCPTHSSWGQAFHTVDSVSQRLPMMNVTGNHEYMKSVIAKLQRRFTLTFSYYLDSEIGHTEGSDISGSQVFTTTMGNVQFFCLDANRELPYLLSQRSWLKDELAKSTAKWKIVVMHHPIYSTRNEKNNAVQRFVFADMFDESDIDLVMQGHEHVYSRNYTVDGDSLTSPLYTISHCSPKQYWIRFYDRFSKYGSGDYYYQTVNTHGDTLTMTTYRMHKIGDTLETSTYDSIQMVKRPTDNRVRNVAIHDFGSQFKEAVDAVPEPGIEVFEKRIDEYKQAHPERF